MKYESRKPGNEAENELRDIAATINVNLPRGDTPLLDGMIGLLTAIGGISAIANILSNAISPEYTGFSQLGLHLIAGLVMIAAGYGILKRRGWSAWLYIGISIAGLYFNPVIALVPILITGYLCSRKIYFDLTIPRNILAYLHDIVSG